MKKIVLSTVKLLRVNFVQLACFEVLYRALTMFIFIPLISFGGKIIMNIMGFRYITQENMNRFILNPLTIVLLFLLLAVAALIETWHVGTVISILNMSQQGKKTTIAAAARHSLHCGSWILHKGNVLLPVFMLIFLPALHVGTGLIGTINIPEHLRDVFFRNPVKLAGISAVYLIAFLLLLRWMFALFYLVVDGDNFFTAVRKSAHLSKGNKFNNLIYLVFTEVFIWCAAVFIFLIGAILIAVLSLLDFFGADMIASAAGIFLIILVFFATVLSVPMSFAVMTSLFYIRKEEKNEPASFLSLHEPKMRSKKAVRLEKTGLILAFCLCVVLGARYVRGVRKGDYNLNVEYVRNTEISAHRGASAYYPENTMAAFKGAVEQNADWIELDVQQSSDGMIYVMHDTNFLRTTGVNKNCWEMSWDEISKLDAGSFFSKEYAGEPIPLLKDVIEYAKDAGIRLNIELKPTGHETDFEKDVVDIINEEDFKDDCVITSQVYNVLKNVKACDESITTVLVTNSALGEIQEKKYADNFSIEATFVNESLVKKMHSLGKEVYAWTIDSESNIDDMLDIGVDNIITNNVPFARECREESRHGNLVWDFLNKIMNL